MEITHRESRKQWKTIFMCRCFLQLQFSPDILLQARTLKCSSYCRIKACEFQADQYSHTRTVDHRSFIFLELYKMEAVEEQNLNRGVALVSPSRLCGAVLWGAAPPSTSIIKNPGLMSKCKNSAHLSSHTYILWSKPAILSIFDLQSDKQLKFRTFANPL